MQMRQLEEIVGLPLIEQIGKKLFLTAAGEEVAQCARAVINQLRATEEALNLSKGMHAGRITLAAVSTAKYFAPQLIAAFCRRYPAIKVKLIVNNREAMLTHLRDNDVDLVIMGQPPRELDLHADVFAAHPLAIIANPTHAFARRRRLRPVDLAEENFIVRETGSGTRSSMERFFKHNRVALRITAEMSSNETIKQAVMAGMGIAFLSLHTIGLELKAKRLIVLPVQGLPEMRQWQVVHHAHKKLSPVAAAFHAFLLEEGAALRRLDDALRRSRNSLR
jgi:LysR family transcriptional regulator, low CO2-responsive transcriptional regulator